MFPVRIESNLDSSYKAKWEKQFVKPNRSRLEAVWRRTQEEKTKDKSAWKNEDDCRRRMIHYLDQYDVIENEDGTVDFVISDAYLWLSVTLPEEEALTYHERVLEALKTNDWTKKSENVFRKEELQISFKKHKAHSEDEAAGRKIPENYRTIEYSLKTDGMHVDEKTTGAPWLIIGLGVRERGSRIESPKILEDLSQLSQYMPFQIELGGGASIDLGIPPFNHLHTIYNVTKKSDGSFVFADDELLPEIISDPAKFYRKAATAYRKALLSEPNEFYILLKDMFDNELAVGQIMTNNFDGFPAALGLNEYYLRRYGMTEIIPKLHFDKRAKSLLVIGNHADRRKVQEQAREKGLKLIYVDPEMYVDYMGNTIQYPLEDLREEDILIKMGAVEFAKKLRFALESEDKL